MVKRSVQRNTPCVASCGQQRDQPFDKDGEPFRLLSEMAEVLGQHFDVSLPVTSVTSETDSARRIKKGKEFSVGLLENPVNHDWSGEIRRASLTKRERYTVAGSLFLWRKTLPSSAAPFSEHMARVTAPEIELPMGYIAHVCTLVTKLFPKGWDRSYHALVDSAVPTVSSVVERGRGKGGWRSTGPDRFHYGQQCLGDVPLLASDESIKVKYMEAQCDGKIRAVTVMHSDAQFLKPLHKLLYNQISKYPWLLRGKANPTSFKKFFRVPGEVFVSGDYESATDHLPVTVAEWILRTAFKNATLIPEAVKVAALRYLRVTLQYPDGTEAKASRQLMGSLLCFPLLCIQNYLAFRWVFGESVPVKINGDDIVFRSTKEKFDEWAEFVGTVGLKLSRGKTLVDASAFSLNSTFFHVAHGQAPRLVPIIRCTSLMREKCPYPSALAGTLRSFLDGFKGDLRDELGSWFLRKKKRMIRGCGRSVVRGLGMWVNETMLKKSDLWHRELWYVNSVPTAFHHGRRAEGVKIPDPPDRLSGQVKLPAGWRRVALSQSPRIRREQREGERDFWDQVTESAWGSVYKPKEVERAYWDAVKMGSFENQFFYWRTKTYSAAARRFVRRLYEPKPERLYVDGEYKLVEGPLPKAKKIGSRSALKSSLLYRELDRKTDGLKGETVWVRVDESSVEQEEEDFCLGEHFGALVREKISLARQFASVYFPKCTERWLDAELAADSYVQ
uniref:RNA-dependent RNA polymerase n=1 Tax=Acremonium sclerotigenum ourmia-like virus 1 TaxID=2587557 RepID=A0A9E9BXH6_9VIRU|nr:MAG: hypothetical protein [Acremonium sclerotigenum ourmia-like virus 1]